MTGKELTDWRKKNKLSQSQLADMVGVTQMTVSNWERGKTQTPDDLRVKLVAALDKRNRRKARLKGEPDHGCEGMEIRRKSQTVQVPEAKPDKEEKPVPWIMRRAAELAAEARMAELEDEIEQERKKEMQETVTDGQNEFLEAEISEREQKVAESKETPQKPLNRPQMTFLELEGKMFSIYRSAECLKEHGIDGAPEVLELAQRQLAQMAGMQYE